MAIGDKNLDFGRLNVTSIQNILGAAQSFPNQIDVGTLADFGKGRQMYLDVLVVSAPTLTVPGTDYFIGQFVFGLATSVASINMLYANGQVDVIGRSGDYAVSGGNQTIGGLGKFHSIELAANRHIYIPVPRLPSYVANTKRFLGLWFASYLGSQTITNGTFDAKIVMDDEALVTPVGQYQI